MKVIGSGDCATTMPAVEAGQELTITRRGVPVAVLTPITHALDLRCDRPAKSRPEYPKQTRPQLAESSSAILSDLRGER